MAEIVISEFMDEEAVARLRARHDAFYNPALVDRPEELMHRVAGARALIVRNRTQVRGHLLAAAKSLSCVGRLGVGLDNIDVETCKARGVAVYPATGANDLAVAEYVMTAALVLLRGVWLSSESVAKGGWPRQRLVGREAAGKIMGLVGFGAIAREVARRAAAFGMNVIAYDPYLLEADAAWRLARPETLERVLELSDVISLHVPLTDRTRHIVGRSELARMKNGAVLINAARGGVVDESALAEALGAGRLSGAALDVFETEPLTGEAGAKFAGMQNVLLTPHIAGVTEESNVRVSDLIANRVIAHLDQRNG